MKSLIIMFCLLTPLSLGQATKTKPTTNVSQLSEGVEIGAEDIKVLDDDAHKATFRLTTSWIPGEEHKGYIRYRINATGIGVNLKDAPQYIKRIHDCSYTLNLYDKGDFVLRRISLIFSFGAADNGDIVAMTANDLSQMDLADYKDFLVKGNWQISWRC